MLREAGDRGSDLLRQQNIFQNHLQVSKHSIIDKPKFRYRSEQYCRLTT